MSVCMYKICIICKYIFMHVCMYLLQIYTIIRFACMNVCMYVCMYVYFYEWRVLVRLEMNILIGWLQ